MLITGAMIHGLWQGVAQPERIQALRNLPGPVSCGEYRLSIQAFLGDWHDSVVT